MSRSILIFVVLLSLAVAPSTVAFVSQGYKANSLSNRSISPRTKSSAVRLANRKGRRLAEDRRKGKGKGKSASKQPKPMSDAKWLQVLDSTSAIEPGSAKVVSGKYQGKELFFALTEYGGTYRAASEACGRCKFPMINGKVKTIDESGRAEDVKADDEPDPEAKLAIACPLCGATFDLSTGVAVGDQPKGIGQQFVSRLLSQTAAERINIYEARKLSSGAIVIRVD